LAWLFAASDRHWHHCHRAKEAHLKGISMRKLIILAILAYVGYGYFTGTLDLPFFGTNQQSPVISNDRGDNKHFSTPPLQRTVSATAQRFQCDGRQHCSQMRSYEEAVFFLRNCPNTKMDGDRDGIPCEQQFGR